MSQTIVIDEEASDIPTDVVFNNEEHNLEIKVDSGNDYVNFEFSSREAMRGFAKSLLHESYYGSGSVELFPLVSENKALVVNGVRLTEKSARVFVWYPENT